MSELDETVAVRLREIADILGVPVECFFRDRAPPAIADVRECLRLWGRLRTDAGRAAALAAMRKISDEEGC